MERFCTQQIFEVPVEMTKPIGHRQSLNLVTLHVNKYTTLHVNKYTYTLLLLALFTWRVPVKSTLVTSKGLISPVLTLEKVADQA